MRRKYLKSAKNYTENESVTFLQFFGVKILSKYGNFFISSRKKFSSQVEKKSNFLWGISKSDF